MIRKDKYVTETCSRCRRPNWTRKISYSLLTEEEQNKIFSGDITKTKGAPEGAENCYASCGSTIHEAVKEGKEIAELMNKQVAFEFNEQLVVIDKYSDVDKEVRQWWIKVYGKTPEESFKER